MPDPQAIMYIGGGLASLIVALVGSHAVLIWKKQDRLEKKMDGFIEKAFECRSEVHSDFVQWKDFNRHSHLNGSIAFKQLAVNG